MQVAKWGNSLAVRLPAGVVQELELKAGDEIAVRAVKEGDAKLTLVVERKRTREEFIKSLATRRWKLPEGYKFNRDELYERGTED